MNIALLSFEPWIYIEPLLKTNRLHTSYGMTEAQQYSKTVLIV